jgi:iron complex transport system substrate-binding protein
MTMAFAACALALSSLVAASTSAAAQGPFPVTVDAGNGKVTIEQKPTKIVSLSPTATEMLFAIGAGGQVIAVDDNSNFPAEVPKSDLSAFQPNAEAIAAKNPDLVVISNDTNKIVDQLTQLKIPVYLSSAARTLDDTYRQLTELGKLTGHPDEAADLGQRMRDDIAKLVKDLPRRAKRLTYYYELDPTYYSVTSKTFMGSLFSLAGLDNVADPADADGAKGGYPQLSAETLVKANPDFVFLADTRCCKQSLETVRARAGWTGVTAVRTGQVVGLDDDIASRWGPRVVDLVRAIVDAVAKVPA